MFQILTFRVVLEEIVARVLKNELRYRFREKMRELQVPALEPFKEEATEFFALLFHHQMASNQHSSPDPNHDTVDFFTQSTWALTEDANTFWKETVKQLISDQFKNALTIEESNHSYDLRESLDVLHVFNRLQELSGVFVTKETQAYLDRYENDKDALANADIQIEDIVVQVKHLT